MALFLILTALAAAAFGYRFWAKRQARARLLASGLTAAEWDILGQEVPLLAHLPVELRGKLEGKINLFLDQVELIGCNGLEVTEEMELSIAAQACLLVVNTDAWYDTLRTVLVYPGAFKSKQIIHDGVVAHERIVVRTGESWARGPVVLSWQHSQEQAQDHRDGNNVVLHEFAHQLDNLSGDTDGTPVLGQDQDFGKWGRAFNAAFDRHVTAVGHGWTTVIDAYGAEGPEEFFAVAVEIFFERPEALHADEPEIYAQLAELFQLRPLEWVKA